MGSYAPPIADVDVTRLEGFYDVALQPNVDKTGHTASAGLGTATAAAWALGSYAFLPPGTYLVGANTVLPGDLWFAPGAKIKPAAGVTVTISGRIHGAATMGGGG